jgi:hypothetical protein
VPKIGRATKENLLCVLFGVLICKFHFVVSNIVNENRLAAQFLYQIERFSLKSIKRMALPVTLINQPTNQHLQPWSTLMVFHDPLCSLSIPQSETI